MTNQLIDRIDRTREAWASELDVCRNEIIDTASFPQNPLARLVVEFDYLLVEAKLTLSTTLKAFDYVCEDSLESVLEEMRIKP